MAVGCDPWLWRKKQGVLQLKCQKQLKQQWRGVVLYDQYYQKYLQSRSSDFIVPKNLFIALSLHL